MRGKQPSTATMPFNPWGHCDPKQCLQCLQTTHELDRDEADIGNRVFLRWTKSATWVSDKLKHPQGNECAKCMLTRLAHCDPAFTAADIRKRRDDEEAFDQKWRAWRKAKISGSAEFAADELWNKDI